MTKEVVKPAILLLLTIMCHSCFNNKNENLKVNTQGVLAMDGVQFRYMRQGRGEPALVIGSSAYYSKAFSDSLKDYFEMIFVDSRHFIPGYNPTDQEVEGLTLTTWADDMEGIRKGLKLDKVTVIGHSIHAQVALEYAKKYPGNINRLVLICGVPYAFTELSDEAERLWNQEADEHRKAILKERLSKQDSIMTVTPANRQFSVGYDLKAPLYWANPEYDAKYLLDELVTSPKVFEKLVNSIPSKQEVMARLRNLKMPTLVVVGKLDYVCPYTAWEQVLQGTNIEYQLMQHASHNPHTEKTTESDFDKILLAWVSKSR